MSLLALLAGAASACPVCFGGEESGIARGLQYGIVILLSVTGLMVAGLFAAVHRIEKARDD